MISERLVKISKAAAYCDCSVGGFRGLVKRQILPGPVKGTKLYDLAAIDRRLDRLSGIAVKEEEPISAYDKWKASQ